MAKFYIAQTNIDYLEEVRKSNGLDSINKALHFTLQDHKNLCTITTNDNK